MPLRSLPWVALAACGAMLAAVQSAPPAIRAGAGSYAARAGGADEPDRVYQIPPGESAPGAIVVLADAGDVADWGHAAIGVAEAWKVTSGKGAVVAVLDTGVDHDHRDLAKQIRASKDFTGSRSGASDVHGHGTHCAGVVLAARNGVGVVGVAPEATLLAGKVLGDRGSGSSSGIAAGIDWAVANGADVISLSLGSSGPDARIHAAVRRADAAGVIVAAAAGNSGPRDNTVDYPGRYPECVCVGAVGERLDVANFSGRGPRVDVAAPGVNVRSCYPGDRFANMSGTSMATPYVAGVAALYVADAKANGRKPTPAEFRKLLTAAARDLPPAGKDTASGYGLVQPGKMFAALPPAPPPKPKEPPAPGVDRLVMDFGPGVDFLGRRLKRIVYEFEPEQP